MSYDEKERPDQIFLYHVYANGCGGYIKRNDSILAVPSIGGTALSSAGGDSLRETGAFRWAPPGDPAPPEGFLIAVDGVITKLWTEESSDEWVSNAEVRVYGFNLCERIKIGLMVSRMTSRHPKGFPRDKMADGGQPRISFEGSQYWNVFVDGVRVHVDIDRDLDRHDTHQKLKTAMNADTVTDYCPSNLAATGPQYMRDLAEKYKSAKLTRCSIVGRIKHEKANGYSLDLTDAGDPKDPKKNLGRVFLGEMLVGDEMKHLNMIRWDLGCDTYGAGSSGSVDMNGVPMP